MSDAYKLTISQGAAKLETHLSGSHVKALMECMKDGGPPFVVSYVAKDGDFEVHALIDPEAGGVLWMVNQPDEEEITAHGLGEVALMPARSRSGSKDPAIAEIRERLDAFGAILAPLAPLIVPVSTMAMAEIARHDARDVEVVDPHAPPNGVSKPAPPKVKPPKGGKPLAA
jgi:hypothetical protein